MLYKQSVLLDRVVQYGLDARKHVRYKQATEYTSFVLALALVLVHFLTGDTFRSLRAAYCC